MAEATLQSGAVPLRPSNLLPPSTGKTAIIAGSVPIAIQELLVDIGKIWGLEWMTPHFCSNIMIVSVALAGWLMHHNQRAQENKNA